MARSWLRFIVLGGIAVGTQFVVGISVAQACTEVQVEPCLGMWTHVPAPSFPVALSETLRVANAYVDAYGYAYLRGDDVLDLPSPLVLERRDGPRWASVDFDLVDEPLLIDGVRGLALVDPQPGDYRLSWAETTCEWDVPIEGTERRIVAAFTMTPHTERPLEPLGTVEAEWIVEERTVEVPSADPCQPQTFTELHGVVAVELTFAEAWRPWADALEVTFVVDDMPQNVPVPVSTEQAAAGVFTFEHDGLCTGAYGKRYDGVRTIGVRAEDATRKAVWSETTEIVIDCADIALEFPLLEDEDEAAEEDEKDPHGCTVGTSGTGSPEMMGSLALLALCGLRRRQRGASRARAAGPGPA